MRLIFLLLFFQLKSFTLLSQDIEFKKGKNLDLKTLKSEYGLSAPKRPLLFGRNLSYTAALFFSPERKLTYFGGGYDGKEFQFSIFSDYLNFQGTKKLTTENYKGKVNLYGFQIIDSKMYVIFGEQFEKEDEFGVYVSEVSSEMKILGTPILLQSFRDLKKYGFNIVVATSDNKKNILVARVYDTKGKEKHKFECKVFTDAFSPVWFKELETDLLDKEVNIRALEIDNKGNLYIMSELSSAKNPVPVLYTYNWEKKNVKKLEIGLPEGNNYGSRLILFAGQNPYIVALNKQKQTFNYYVAKIDINTQTSDIIGKNTMPKSFSESADYRSFEYNDWNVTDIVQLTNGNMAASIEAKVFNSKYKIEYCYNTFIICFDENGQTKWSREVHKKQSALIGMNGHLLAASGDNVYVIYNDDLENLNKKPTVEKVKIFNGKGGVAVVQKFDAAGNVTKFKLDKSNDAVGESLMIGNLSKIENNFYFGNIVNIKSMLSFDYRAFTLKIN